MKVKVLKSIASHNWSYAPGQEVDIDEKLAKIWIKSGIAEGGDLIGTKDNNASDNRTNKSSRSKTSSKS